MRLTVSSCALFLALTQGLSARGLKFQYSLKNNNFPSLAKLRYQQTQYYREISTQRRASAEPTMSVPPEEPTSQREGRDPIIWTAPNILTISRMFAIPFLGVAWHSRRIRTAIFLGAAVTDWLDGFLARRMKVSSRFGAFLDPVADKLMVVASLVLLSAEMGMAVAVPSAAILCREIGVSALREWMAESGERDVVAVSFAGKIKTSAQLAAIVILLSGGPQRDRGMQAGFQSFRNVYHSSNMIGLGLLYVATIATILSGFGYFRAAWPILIKKG